MIILEDFGKIYLGLRCDVVFLAGGPSERRCRKSVSGEIGLSVVVVAAATGKNGNKEKIKVSLQKTYGRAFEKW